MSQGGKNSSFGGKHWFTFYSIVYELCDPGSITEPLWALPHRMGFPIPTILQFGARIRIDYV